MRQLILELLPESPPRLDNFVTGGNGETLTGLAAWLAPDNRESSLLLYGDSACGKTHLLRACATTYLDAALDPDLAEPEPEPLSDTPVQPPPGVVAVDNVEALSAAGQIALFNLFNRARAGGGRLLTAACHAPRHLALREDLRTRLGSGLMYRLHTLSDDEKIAALTTQAAARGLRLPADAFPYVLAHAPRDMRSLAALIVALDRYSLEHQRAVTMPLLRDVLGHISSDFLN